MSQHYDTTDGLCACGCGGLTNIYRGKHSKFIPGHHKRKSPVDFIVEDRGFTTPCWVWKRAMNNNGYGRVTVGKRAYSAHVLYFIQAKGEVPDGLEIDHLCRVRECVNPDHLEAVTRSENMKRGSGGFKRSLTDQQIEQIKTLLKSNTQPELAAMFGVSRATIARIAATV